MKALCLRRASGIPSLKLSMGPAWRRGSPQTSMPRPRRSPLPERPMGLRRSAPRSSWPGNPTAPHPCPMGLSTPLRAPRSSQRHRPRPTSCLEAPVLSSSTSYRCAAKTRPRGSPLASTTTSRRPSRRKRQNLPFLCSVRRSARRPKVQPRARRTSAPSAIHSQKGSGRVPPTRVLTSPSAATARRLLPARKAPSGAPRHR
mmetsp:Transcript_12519/g.29761  ORF Transcript_12519/g.29761 Transcript_12519/m.29761 type:complete len:201 (-) Transcript_12519:866-1468(-)